MSRLALTLTYVATSGAVLATYFAHLALFYEAWVPTVCVLTGALALLRKLTQGLPALPDGLSLAFWASSLAMLGLHAALIWQSSGASLLLFYGPYLLLFVNAFQESFDDLEGRLFISALLLATQLLPAIVGSLLYACVYLQSAALGFLSAQRGFLQLSAVSAANLVLLGLGAPSSEFCGLVMPLPVFALGAWGMREQTLVQSSYARRALLALHSGAMLLSGIVLISEWLGIF